MLPKYSLTSLIALILCSASFGQRDEDNAFTLTKTPRNRSLKMIDDVYSKMTPLKYEPAKDRWKSLPITAKILGKSKGELRVVMLGDSIVNDTSRSLWDQLVQRRHPDNKITKITCVRGSTGCWWYKEEGRVKRYVLDHEPDLLIIGGISQRNDLDSIRSVIKQVRAARECDILLMSGAFGRVDPGKEGQWSYEIKPDTYRAHLQKLAKEMDCAFLDMRAHWGKYIRESKKDLDWFKRDVVHANQRGEQIIGRILAGYLTLNKK